MYKNGRKIKNAIFDVDGTILDSMDFWYEIPSRYLAKKNVSVPYEINDAFLELSFKQGVEELKRYIPDTTKNDLLSMIHDFYAYEVQPIEGMCELVRSLYEERIGLHVLTTGDVKLVKLAFERLGIEDCFISYRSCVDKHTSQPYLDMGYVPDETIVFEDVDYALQSAKEAGFYTVGVGISTPYCDETIADHWGHHLDSLKKN